MKTIITLENVEDDQNEIETTIEFQRQDGMEFDPNMIMPTSAMIGGFIMHLLESGKLLEMATEYYEQINMTQEL